MAICLEAHKDVVISYLDQKEVVLSFTGKSRRS
jgi:hypothetical protein